MSNITVMLWQFYFFNIFFFKNKVEIIPYLSDFLEKYLLTSNHSAPNCVKLLLIILFKLAEVTSRQPVSNLGY